MVNAERALVDLALQNGRVAMLSSVDPLKFVTCPFMLDDTPTDPCEGPDGRMRKFPLSGGGWAYAASRYEDVRQILSGGAFVPVSTTVPKESNATFRKPILGPEGSLMARGPRHHLIARRLLAPPLSRPRVEQRRTRVAQVMRALIQAQEPMRSYTDFRAKIAAPFARTVMVELLGITVDQSLMQQLFEVVLRPHVSPLEALRSARGDVYEIIGESIERRSPGQGSSLIDNLIRAGAEGIISRREVVGITALLYMAGSCTVTEQLTNQVLQLLVRRSHWEAICRDQSLIPTAVEELLRRTPLTASGGAPRLAGRDTRIGGTVIRKGEVVMPINACANRDPSVFADAHEFDLARPSNPHVAFGFGPHHCLGAALARLQLQVALTALSRHCPNMRLVEPVGVLRCKKDFFLRGLESLPVAW